LLNMFSAKGALLYLMSFAVCFCCIPVRGGDSRPANPNASISPKTFEVSRIIQVSDSLAAPSSFITVDQDGTTFAAVYETTNGGETRLYAFEPDGTSKSGWPFVAPAEIVSSSPTIGPDGTIYAAFGKS